MQFESLLKDSGPFKSSASLKAGIKTEAEVYFHFREKSEIAMVTGSSWYGGDYFEFGSGDLNTFRNMLTAYDICGMTRAYEDVRFYAFDIFGDLGEGGQAVIEKDGHADYFHPYTVNGDQFERHRQYLSEHGLFVDKCHLVQGLFENTLTPEFKGEYLGEGRRIGFAFLDCNMGKSYKTVFEYVFDMLGENSYIYMDEYFQSPTVIGYYSQFCEELRRQRNMGSVYIRNAGGFGGLFRLYPTGNSILWE